ncbi:MAG TPA: histone deacetylase [Solirubrobacterales bacterium]|nr:histone deacetylase [Solirubrobacterales bacterium]
MLYLSHPSSLKYDPRELMPGHPDVPDRIVALEAHLAELEWLGADRRQAPAATEEQLRLVHSERLVDSIAELDRNGGGGIDADTVVVPGSWDAALHAAGGACELVRALLAGEDTVGYCAVRPSGHHAEPDRAMGFCLFNNVAIAAEYAIHDLGARKVFVLDWDVHHGNGTEAAFRDRADVLFASIHQGGIYPGTGRVADIGSGAGEGFTVNLPVPAGSGAETWLPLVEQALVPLAESFEPDLILISAGYDAHRADPLAGCTLESEDFAAMARQVRDLAARLGVPLGAVQEGGYHPASMAESAAATMVALGE